MNMKCFSMRFEVAILAAAMGLATSPLGAQATRSDGKWAFENASLRVSVDEATAAWSVVDKRCGRLWRQSANTAAVAVKGVASLPSPAQGVQMNVAYSSGKDAPLPLTVRLSLLGGEADVAYEISGDVGAAIREINLPAPFVLDDPEGRLVIPHNAGLLFGVNELEWDGKALGGFMSMPWFAAADLASGQGYVGILETPDDAFYRGRKVRGERGDVLSVQPYFLAQKGRLGYARRILYHFADRGGYVTLAKRYRAYAREKGLVKTLAEKRKERPNIDLLVGAVNVYGSEFQNVEQLQRLGIERVMVSGFSKDKVRKINGLGYLSSHYDIYTDLYEPGTPPSRWERCQGFTFPNDVIKRADGTNQAGWCPIVNPKTGKKDPSYVICWTCGLRTLREKMPARLRESPFSAYFLDCVTATGLYECYDAQHPLTRTTDRETRVRQFAYLSKDLGLVVGSEQGRDWAVPVADYFEGVMSTAAFFANPKEIHQIPFVSLEADPRFARYEEYGANPRRQAPLFQLVYGDCCETTWRWGDNSHRMPGIWWKKDLLAMVHAAMPTWVLWKPQQQLFTNNLDRFQACYETVCRWRRAVGYSEMINHERLSKDGLVQRTSFANGASLMVNFAEESRDAAGGVTLPGRSFLIQGDASLLAGLPVGKPVSVRDDWQPRPQASTPAHDVRKKQ